jgi:DNA polymerase-1
MKDFIKICCQIHDAQYYLIKDEAWVLEWLNTNLVREVTWQNHPDIYHDQVKLSGKVSVFYPSWAQAYTIPNNASYGEIGAILYEIKEPPSK